VVDQPSHVNPQLPHLVGFRPASNASSPSGKKQIATMITHAGYPAFCTSVLHLGQDTVGAIVQAPYLTYLRARLNYAFQVKPHFEHTVGLRPARSDSNPIGNKQILTMIAHVGNPALLFNVLHLGQEIEAIEIS
jgi:hypothetical protein